MEYLVQNVGDVAIADIVSEHVLFLEVKLVGDHASLRGLCILHSHKFLGVPGNGNFSFWGA